MAQFNNYNPPVTAYRYAESFYYAKSTVAGQYTEGELIRKTEKINVATDAVVSTAWFNLDTQAIITAAPAVADLETIDGSRIQVGAVEFKTLAGAAASTLTVPANANYATLQVQGTDVYVRYDGTAATNAVGGSNGVIQNDGAVMYLQSANELSKFSVIPATALGAGKLVVHYYRILGFNVD